MRTSPAPSPASRGRSALYAGRNLARHLPAALPLVQPQRRSALGNAWHESAEAALSTRHAGMRDRVKDSRERAAAFLCCFALAGPGIRCGAQRVLLLGSKGHRSPPNDTQTAVLHLGGCRRIGVFFFPFPTRCLWHSGIGAIRLRNSLRPLLLLPPYLALPSVGFLVCKLIEVETWLMYALCKASCTPTNVK